jgi:cobalt/nickel transport protein
MKKYYKYWVAILIFALLSPLGLIIPDHFQAGSAWGEWGADEMFNLIGYVPQGLKKISVLWNAPLPDYSFQGWEERGLAQLSYAYIISALLGITIIFIIFSLAEKFFIQKAD